jgi:hypothetical protein
MIRVSLDKALDDISNKRAERQVILTIGVCFAVGILVGRPGALWAYQVPDGVSPTTEWFWFNDSIASAHR